LLTIGTLKTPGYQGMCVNDEDYVTNNLTAISVLPADICYIPVAG